MSNSTRNSLSKLFKTTLNPTPSKSTTGLLASISSSEKARTGQRAAGVSQAFSLRRFRSFGSALLVLPLILLTACGNGGGGGGGGGDRASNPTPTPTPTPPQPCVRATEGCLTESELNSRKFSLGRTYRSWGGQAYTNSYFLDRINADYAYGHLKLMRNISIDQLGAGVDIGMFAAFNPGDNSHILQSHRSFQGLFPRKNCVVDSCANDTLTALASVAVGRRFDSSRGMFGVAPGAGLTYSSWNNKSITSSQLNSSMHRLLVTNNVDILMIPSWGLSTQLDNYSDNPVNALTTLRNNYSDTIIVSDVGDDLNALTWEADNRNMPLVMAARANCGSRVTNYCITVPYNGSYHYAADDNTNDISFARYTDNLSSGIVAGGLAVMKQLFRSQLTPLQLRSRLFTTANKSGIYANRSRYGQGLMDLGAATSPWGVPAFMGTRSSALGSTGASIDSSFLRLGGPLGDGLAQSLGQQEVAAFDTLGAPFWFEAASFTVPSQGVSLATRLHHFLSPAPLRSIPDTWQFSLQEDATATEMGHLALTNGASRLTMDAPQGFSATLFHDPQDMEGLTLSWSPAALLAFTMETGYLKEHQSLLGSRASGAFGQLSGRTLFLNAGVNTPSWGWQLAAQGELGMVDPSIGSSPFIDDLSPLTTSAFRLQASKPFLGGGAFHLSLAQPLRVDSGAADLSLPTGRTPEGTVVGQERSASLVPSGRQLDLTAMVELPLAEETTLSLGATRSQQPQHQQAAEAEWTFFTGWRSQW